VTKYERKNWIINIENTATTVEARLGSAVVEYVFKRYDAHGLYDLSPSYYSEVFGDLELIANDN
jgi:hypothetical protein